MSFVITQNDLVKEDGSSSSIPVRIVKRTRSDSVNRVEVSWTNRDQDYSTSVVVANDETDQRVSGKVKKEVIDLQGITNIDYATTMGYRILFDKLHRINTYEFTISYKNLLLEPGDVGTISDGYLIDKESIRILSIDEDENNKTARITAIEDLVTLYIGSEFTSQNTERVFPDYYAGGDLTGPLAVTFREKINTPIIELCITPGDAYVNGWYIYRSYDNVSYEWVGICSVNGVTGGNANSAGTLTTRLPAYPAVIWRGNESFRINIGTLTDIDTTVSDTTFFNNLRLCKIDNEILAYQNVEETSVEGVWEITGIIRGLFGTEPVAHTIGSTFYTLTKDFTYNFKEEEIGKTLYFKCLPFYQSAIQSLADASSFSVVVQGYYQRPAGVSVIRTSSDELYNSNKYYNNPFTLYWNLGSKNTGYNNGGYDLDEDGISIWKYGNNESDLINSNGVFYGSYIEDPELQSLEMIFYQTDDTLLSSRNINILESDLIYYDSDLINNDPAKIKIIPRRSLGSREEHSLTVDQLRI